MSQFARLTRDVQALRVKLLGHPLYGMIDSLTNLRIFMEYHVFAVWDFMSLLKSLQRSQTSVEIPWCPRPNPTTTRFINEIVLCEESDEDGAGGYTSHFELYRSAMKECGASTAKIDDLVEQVGKGVDISQALVSCGADASVAEFVQSTWWFIKSDRPHRVAAAFTLGREDVLPGIFRSCVVSLGRELETGLPKLRYYLERHIELDEDRHAPMAIKVMHELCGNDRKRWEEASEAVQKALRARIALWDGIVSAIRQNQISAHTSSDGNCPSEPDSAVA
jgi:Protein of unknown function (DUF3050)